MASGINQNPVPKLYRSVMEDVINNVREVFLDEGVEEQVLQELKQIWESKLQQAKTVDGFHSEEQLLLQAAQGQQGKGTALQKQPHVIQIPNIPAGAQIVVQDGRSIQHISTANMTASATAATMALPQGMVPPYQITGGLPGQMIQAYKHVMVTPQGQQIILQQPTTMLASVGGQQLLVQTSQAGSSGTVGQPGGAASQGTVIQQGQGTQHVLTQLGTGTLPPGVVLQHAAPQHQVVLGKPPSSTASAATTSGGSGSTGPSPLVIQVDGAGDTSSDEDEDDANDDDKDKDDELGDEDDAVEEDPLNSEDDVSEDDPSDLFDTDNVVVCQYDKIHRSKNRWKFHLKDGIMNLNGKDYVFSKAVGDAEW
ncbi:transcription initiation factor IIA subunit 1 isoform X1 [Petromyzon marinus]|uniref:Transcription initiation factor IIA subunit 1-like isoform X1 n=1 Tax=Petromyzon marinus TaxID=7757 RepID=A0AAJ7WW82_PETMA|nr:transcription initiation factor IIA subunit 1-like isoform X1 [Petromyzon marinus]